MTSNGSGWKSTHHFSACNFRKGALPTCRRENYSAPSQSGEKLRKGEHCDELILRLAPHVAPVWSRNDLWSAIRITVWAWKVNLIGTHWPLELSFRKLWHVQHQWNTVTTITIVICNPCAHLMSWYKAAFLAPCTLFQPIYMCTQTMPVWACCCSCHTWLKLYQFTWQKFFLANGSTHILPPNATPQPDPLCITKSACQPEILLKRSTMMKLSQ